MGVEQWGGAEAGAGGSMHFNAGLEKQPRHPNEVAHSVNKASLLPDDIFAVFTPGLCRASTLELL